MAHLHLHDASAAWAQPGQELKLAASPLTASGNPFMDLPFSPRAAFIWDQTRQAISWMNAAARAKFGFSLEGLTDALPKTLTRKFGQYVEKAERGEASYGSVKLKIAPHPALDCCLDMLELASGHRGLVVAEGRAPPSAPGQPRSLKAPPKNASIKRRRQRKTGIPDRQMLKRPAMPAPQLTPEELRSFKAVGRAVRKLCREKQPSAAPALRLAGDLAFSEQKRPISRVQTPLCLPFSAFDTILFLDKNLDVAGCAGRPQCLGWRKSGLLGQAAVQFLPAGEQTILYRMIKKLGSTTAQICRETIVIADGTGSGIPCRAVLGYWEHGNAHYFLALIALKVPPRLKKLQYQLVNRASITRLAA